MDALRGLSALASQMSPLQPPTGESQPQPQPQPQPQSQPQPQPRMSDQARGSPPSSTSSSTSASLLPPRKRNYEGDASYYPASWSAAAPPMDLYAAAASYAAAHSGAALPSRASAAAASATEFVDEAALIEMELARRRRLLGLSSSERSISKMPMAMSHHQHQPFVSSYGRMSNIDANADAELGYFLLKRAAKANASIAVPSSGWASAAPPPPSPARFLNGNVGGNHGSQMHTIPRQHQPRQYEAYSDKIGPALFASSHNNQDLFAKARAAEARAQQALYQPRGDLCQERLYQEALISQQQQQMLLSNQRQENKTAATATSAIMQEVFPNGTAAGDKMAFTAMQDAFPNGMTAEDMLAFVEFSEAKKKAKQASSQTSSLSQESTTDLPTSQSTIMSKEDIYRLRGGKGKIKSLHLPRDSVFLNEAHCFIRFCIEPFIVTNLCPSSSKSHGITSKQVGLRCVHCRDSQIRARGAEWYPSKLKDIYKGAQIFQKVHFHLCSHIPEEMKVRYKISLEREQLHKRSEKLFRAYYVQSAAEMGLVDGPHGYMEYRGDSAERRPSKDMKRILDSPDLSGEEEFLNYDVGGSLCSPDKKIASLPSSTKKILVSADDDDIKYCKFISIASDSTREVIYQAKQESTNFVATTDFPTISDYVYLLYHQLIPCKPTKATIKRRRLSAEQLKHVTGLCCKHCHHTGIANGMYFPLSVDSLGDSSFGQTLMLHLTSCVAVPKNVKRGLMEVKALAKEHKSSVRRGAKKVFIEKVWKRMEEYSKKENGDDHREGLNEDGRLC